MTEPASPRAVMCRPTVAMEQLDTPPTRTGRSLRDVLDFF